MEDAARDKRNGYAANKLGNRLRPAQPVQAFDGAPGVAGDAAAGDENGDGATETERREDYRRLHGIRRCQAQERHQVDCASRYARGEPNAQ